MNKIKFMKAALREARKAFEQEEIPVGAVIVKDNTVIASAYNTNRQKNNPIMHAEIIAIEKACSILHNERLIDCDIYVTKEPCAMCAGAILHARIRRLVIGTKDYRYGACGTVLSVCGNKSMNHIPEIKFGVLDRESRGLLQEFFKERRGIKGGESPFNPPPCSWS